MERRGDHAFGFWTLVVLVLACLLMTLLSKQIGLVVVLLLFMGPRFWRWYRRMLR